MSNTPILDSIAHLARREKQRNWKTSRPLLGRDDDKFRANYDRIFRKKKKQK